MDVSPEKYLHFLERYVPKWIMRFLVYLVVIWIVIVLISNIITVGIIPTYKFVEDNLFANTAFDFVGVVLRYLVYGFFGILGVAVASALGWIIMFSVRNFVRAARVYKMTARLLGVEPDSDARKLFQEFDAKSATLGIKTIESNDDNKRGN